MTRSGDIEFLDGDGPAAAGDEEIGDAHRLPRWVLGLGAVALLAVAVVSVVANTGHSRRHPAVSVAPSGSAPPILTHPTAVGPVPPADALRLPGGTLAVDVTVAGNRLYVLQSDRITVVDSHTSAVLKSYPFESGLPTENLRLVPDVVNERMWVVDVGGQSTNVLDTSTFESIADVEVPGTIRSAVVLDGLLFVTTEDGVYSVDGASAQRVFASDRPLAIAADWSRHRLLVLSSGRPSRIYALSELGHVQAQAALDVTGGELGVVGADIWLTGTDADGAQVRTLDPRTLLPGPNNVIAEQLSPGARIAGTGDESLWLRSTGRNRDVLWCHDNDGGPPTSWWTLTGRVSSDRGVGFVVDAGSVRPLTLFTGCTG